MISSGRAVLDREYIPGPIKSSKKINREFTPERVLFGKQHRK
jgi:hypothetical protein